MSPRAQWATSGLYSNQSKRRSSNWLQNGCRIWEAVPAFVPALKLGIHPEMERPAILNTSMPSTAGATIRILAFQERPLELIFREVPPRDKERNLQLLEGVYQMGSGFSRRIPPSAHASRRLLTRHLKTCLLVTLFTNQP